MLRKFACAVFILGLGFSLAAAEDFGATIKKVDGDKITFAKRDKDKKVGEDMTLSVAKDAKVVKGTFNKETMKVDAGDAITDGLKNEMFTKIGEKGLFARISTSEDGKNITEIRVIQFGKKGKDKGKTTN